MLSRVRKKIKVLRRKYKNNKKFRKNINITALFVFALVGVALMGMSMASSPKVVTPKSAQSPACGARVQNYNYQVPFGDAPWNVPVCNLPKFSQSDDYSKRLWNYGVFHDGGQWQKDNIGQFGIEFGMGPAETSWSRAVYYAKDATTTMQVRVCTNNCYPSNFDDGKNMYTLEAHLPERKFPWNPSWKVPGAGDNEVVIIDEDKGLLYSFASVKTGALATAQCGLIAPERLCASSAKILRTNAASTKDRKVADYRTFEGSDGSRGVGFNYFATLLTPQEIEAGEIRHALGMAMPNTMFGPECTKQQLATNDWKNVIGKQCGTAIAPAAKFEWPNAKSVGERLPSLKGSLMDKEVTLSQTIPEGMRFALNMSEAEIDEWIRKRPDLNENNEKSRAKARTAKIIAMALKDYGWISVDTNGARAGIQTAGGVSDVNRKVWNRLGITSEDDDKILAGLFTPSNIYVVEPSTNYCTDGTKSKFYCEYDSSKYEVSGTVVPTPPTNTPTAPSPSPSPSPAPTPNPSTPNQPQPTQNDPNAKNPAPGSNQTPPNNNQYMTPTSVVVSNNIPVEVGWNSKLFEFHQGAKLSWTASNSPNGISKYVVKKNGKTIYEGTSLRYTDFGIDDGQKYTYEITAVDKKGNISQPTIFERYMRCSWFGWVCGFETK